MLLLQIFAKFLLQVLLNFSQNNIHLSWSFIGIVNEWKTWAKTLECDWDIICLCMCVYSFLNIIIYILWKQEKRKKMKEGMYYRLV